ncbi:copper resistance CopC family protein [Candidatus Poriferisocius sp.]|uniref:copper resistance CopC family protein n=1 Tax=Candidatus Poriferisocius sp. TaxID=3101276 RepID=UPI003B515D96
MRVRARKIVALVVAIAIVLALLLSLLAVFSSTAAAHAEMRRSAPSPGQLVGGVVDRVEMEFRDPIRPHQSNGVGLLYPDGTRILTMIEVNGHLVRGRFDTLTEPGTYKVIWQLLDDSDGDWNPPEELEFTYDPAAASPEWLPASAAEGSGGGGGISGSTLALVVVIPVAVVLAAWVFWPRKRKSAQRKRLR